MTVRTTDVVAAVQGAAAAADGPAAVRVAGVSRIFGRGAPPVLDGVDLTVAPGEFVCLLGASGCGKSTLLNLVTGLDAPSAGGITLNTSRPAGLFHEGALVPWAAAGRHRGLALRRGGRRRGRRPR